MDKDAPTRPKSHIYLRQIFDLLTYPPLWLIGLGSSCFAFVYLGVALWLPLRRAEIAITFVHPTVSGLVFIVGLAGLFYGARLSDCIERKAGNGSLKVMLLSFVLSLPSLWVCHFSTSSFLAPAAYLALLFTLNLSVAPLLTVFPSYVPSGLRVQAVALQIVFVYIFVFGAGPFHPLQIHGTEQIENALAALPVNLAVTLPVTLPAMLVFAGVMWIFLLLFYWRPVPWPEASPESSPGSALTAWPVQRTKRNEHRLSSVESIPWFQAHRGFRPDSSVVENTLLAFRRAKEAGAEMLECDVHLTRDQEVVVFHDFDLQRLGNGPEKVAEISAEELFRRTGAPRLIDLLNEPASPQFLNIELKTGRVRDEGEFERKVVDNVREAKAECRVLFSSFNPFALRRLAQLAPQIPRALLVTERPLKFNRFYFKKMLLGSWCRPHLVHVEQSMVTPHRLTRWAWRGLPVAVWTVNDPQRARELLQMGVISVISDCALSSEL